MGRDIFERDKVDPWMLSEECVESDLFLFCLLKERNKRPVKATNSPKFKLVGDSSNNVYQTINALPLAPQRFLLGLGDLFGHTDFFRA